MKRIRCLSIVVVVLALMRGQTGSGQVSFEGATTITQSGLDGSRNIVTEDHFVPHISTVPANQGEQVKLFVRERVRRGHHRERPVILMIGGASTPSVAVFDLPFHDYSWMAFLARAGFDVFAMDFTGYGV